MMGDGRGVFGAALLMGMAIVYIPAGMAITVVIERQVSVVSTMGTVKKATIHQVTPILTTSKNVLFPGHNHLLTTGTHDLTR